MMTKCGNGLLRVYLRYTHKYTDCAVTFVVAVAATAATVIILSNILILNKSEEQIRRKPTKQTHEWKCVLHGEKRTKC